MYKEFNILLGEILKLTWRNRSTQLHIEEWVIWVISLLVTVNGVFVLLWNIRSNRVSFRMAKTKDIVNQSLSLIRNDWGKFKNIS